MKPRVLLVLLAAAAAGCGDPAGRTAEPPVPEAPRAFESPEPLAEVREADLEESSGLVSAGRHPGRFYTVNDGSPDTLFLLDPESGVVRRWRLAGAEFADVEALARARIDGRDEVILGDLGDNGRDRADIRLVRLPEPGEDDREVRPAGGWTLTYEGGPRDAEALLVAPDAAWAVVVEKVETGPSGVYAADLPPGGGRATLRRVAWVEVGGMLLGSQMVTAADQSADGRHVVLRTYAGLHEFDVPGEWDAAPGAWAASEPRSIEAPTQNQGEAVAYGGDGALVLTSEQVPFRVYRISPRGSGPSRQTPDSSVRTR